MDFRKPDLCLIFCKLKLKKLSFTFLRTYPMHGAIITAWCEDNGFRVVPTGKKQTGMIKPFGMFELQLVGSISGGVERVSLLINIRRLLHRLSKFNADKRRG